MENIWALLALIVSAMAAFIALGAKRDAKTANERSNTLAEDNNQLMQKANELQERIVRIEETRELERNQGRLKARLRCYRTSLRRGFNQLVIENSGQVRAEGINVVVNSYPIRQHNGFNIDDFEEVQRLDRGIDPNSRVVLNYALEFGDPDVSHIQITWRNPDNSIGEFETSL